MVANSSMEARPTAMKAISLVDDADAEGLHRQLGPFWTETGDLQVFARTVTTASPYMLCGIVLALHWFSSRCIRVSLEAPQFSRHLEEMGFYDVLPSNLAVRGRDPQSPPHNWKALLPLRQITTYEHIEQATLEFIENCRGATGWIRGIGTRVGEECLAEALNNVYDHSESSVGGFAAAWTYAKDGPLNISVVDSGVGIPAHLRRRATYSHLSDHDALNICVQERVSGLENKERGFGLFHLREAARAAGRATVVLRAGEAEMRARLQGRHDNRVLQPVPKTPGTWVRIEIAKK